MLLLGLRSIKKARRGFIPIAAIIGIALVGSLVIGSAYVWGKFFRYNVFVHIRLTYGWDLVSHGLLALLSSTHNGEKVSKLMGEYVVMGEPDEVPSMLKGKLDKMFGEDSCYKLSVGDSLQVKSDYWEGDDCGRGGTSRDSKGGTAVAKISVPHSASGVTREVNLQMVWFMG